MASAGIDGEFLQSLRCPLSGRPLRLASATERATLNQQIEAGLVYTRLGTRVTQVLDDVLVSDDGPWAYAVCAGVPQLVTGEALAIPK